jgi:O-antigen/teichoic acid export membrane protein
MQLPILGAPPFKPWMAFLIFAGALLAIGVVGALNAMEFRVLTGAFLPGFICLIIALWLRKNEARKNAARNRSSDGLHRDDS